MRYEYFIGLRYLRARRRQIFISVITLISIVGVMVGSLGVLVGLLAGVSGVLVDV